MGGSKGVQLLAAHAIWRFSDPAHAIWWVADTFPLVQNPILWLWLFPTCNGIILFAPIAVKRGSTVHLN